LEEDGDIGIAFCFRSKIFSCSVTDMEKVSPFEVGQEIRVMPSITEPLLGWSNETPSTSGKIASIDMDGTLNVSMLIFFYNFIVVIFNFWCKVCWC
jgi:E3 ubiquitin-protein ligase KEG